MVRGCLCLLFLVLSCATSTGAVQLRYRSNTQVSFALTPPTPNDLPTVATDVPVVSNPDDLEQVTLDPIPDQLAGQPAKGTVRDHRAQITRGGDEDEGAPVEAPELVVGVFSVSSHDPAFDSGRFHHLDTTLVTVEGAAGAMRWRPMMQQEAKFLQGLNPQHTALIKDCFHPEELLYVLSKSAPLLSRFQSFNTTLLIPRPLPRRSLTGTDGGVGKGRHPDPHMEGGVVMGEAGALSRHVGDMVGLLSKMQVVDGFSQVDGAVTDETESLIAILPLDDPAFVKDFPYGVGHGGKVYHKETQAEPLLLLVRPPVSPQPPLPASVCQFLAKASQLAGVNHRVVGC